MSIERVKLNPQKPFTVSLDVWEEIQMREKPIFEVRTSDGRVMAIYEDGRIEGFPPEFTIIINRIPMVFREAIREAQR